jgi:hypothetical protein
MPGGLLQLVAYGQANLILTGNPKTTFFKAAYKPYTPFGMQRFRLDYNGQRTLSFDSNSIMEFKIPRYAELLWDTYIVVNLPDIWSPLFYRDDVPGSYVPYEFQWINDIGFAMIHQITIYSGGNTLAQYSGEWMMNAVRRDEGGKRILLGQMTGSDRHLERLIDPATFWGGNYPNAIWNPDCASTGIEPSIRGKQLYIPLMAWFCYSTKTALPLIALQYQEVHIKIEFRPVRDIFTILNVEQPIACTNCTENKDPFVPALHLKRKAPNSASVTDQLWKFIQPPTGIPKTPEENHSLYRNRRNDWNADVHLIGTYVFLGEDERRQMAKKCHSFLIKEQYEWDYLNVTGSRRVDIPSKDMVSSYMWRFRRSDVNQRNQWFNYSNFEYEGKPGQPPVLTNIDGTPISNPFGCTKLADCNPLSLYSSGCMSIKNQRNIMLDMAILCGQDYRENILAAGVYAYVEKWFRTTGIAKYGLYCYNFCTNSSRLTYQPTGAQNTNKWQYITFEFNTIEPPRNPDLDQANVDVLCDPSGNIIGVRKDLWTLNEYNFDLRVFEERYNMIEIQGGRIGLAIAR